MSPQERERTAVLEESNVHVDQIHEIHPLRASTLRRQSFLAEFAHSKGPPQIVILIILLAIGIGSTIGVVPAVMTDRYARLIHHFESAKSCSSFAVKPPECLAGSADAQTAVATEQMISNVLTFFTSSLIGSLSDEHGRKVIMTIGIVLSSLSPLCLVAIQFIPTMSPNWYYFCGALTGLVSWIAVALSALSDVMPPQWRAPSYGLLLAGFSLGFAMAPQLALLLGHFYVSILSLVVVWMGLITVIFFLPETLPAQTALEAQAVRMERMENLTTQREKIKWMLHRPFWELSILNRSNLFRLLSSLAFFSGMVSSGDRTLLLYYIEERLGFTDKDVATMFLIMGVLGILVQGVMLKFLNDCLGERKVIMLAFTLGTATNLCYGLAPSKSWIYIGVSISAFSGIAFPAISAIKSNNVAESEQGRIQGALYSLQALASGLGPVMMRFVYHYTKDGAFLGPGSMFVVAGALYIIAIYCSWALPVGADTKKNDDTGIIMHVGPTEQDAEATRPLLGSP